MSGHAAGAPRRLTHGPITPALLRLAWPVFLSRSLHTLYGVADTVWVGRLGAEAIAAVSTSFFASWSLYAVGAMFVAGVTALVSQAVGAGRDDDAARVVITGLVLGAVSGVGIAVAGWFGAPLLFRVLFHDPQVIALGSRYLSVISLTAPVIYPVFVVESMYRSCGDSRTPMLVALAGTLLNIALDPLLILGVGPFPRLEVLGAAIATVVGEGTTLLIVILLYRRRRFPLTFRLSGVRRAFSVRRARQVFRIGAPEAVIEVLFSGVYLVLAHVTGLFGAAATAALGVVNRLEAVTYLTAAAIGMAVATMVGQNLGAAKPRRAELSARSGGRLILAVSGSLTLLFLLLPGPLVAFFTRDPAAVSEAVLFLRIVAVSQVFMGMELVYGHAFVGAGDTLPPMYVSVSTSLIRVPLAWWLALHTQAGTAGIWWTITVTGILRGILLVFWFRLGRWKTKDLRVGTPAPSPASPAPIGPEGPEG